MHELCDEVALTTGWYSPCSECGRNVPTSQLCECNGVRFCDTCRPAPELTTW